MKKFYLTIFICCLSFINVFAQCPITVNDAGVCAGQCATLTASGATSYVWSNGSTTASTIVCPSSTTPYTVTGTAIGGCTAQAVAVVSVFPRPYADFIATPNPAGVGNPIVTFTDQSSADVISWSWDFGDGVTSALMNPVYTYPSITATYTVTLDVQNGGFCSNSVSHEIVVCPFSAHYTTTYDTLQNTFTLTVDSTSTANSNTYLWNFGDGNTSTLAAPTHIYPVDSVYYVCLKITTASNDTCLYCSYIGNDYLGNIYRTNGFTINVKNPNILTDIASLPSSESNYILSPNPTNGETAILFNHSVNNINIKGFNIAGQKILEKTNLSGNHFSIDISDQTAGIYFVEILIDGNVLRQKLVKE